MEVTASPACSRPDRHLFSASLDARPRTPSCPTRRMLGIGLIGLGKHGSRYARHIVGRAARGGHRRCRLPLSRGRRGGRGGRRLLWRALTFRSREASVENGTPPLLTPPVGGCRGPQPPK